jgi:hypothetical protein
MVISLISASLVNNPFEKQISVDTNTRSKEMLWNTCVHHLSCIAQYTNIHTYIHTYMYTCLCIVYDISYMSILSHEILGTSLQ